MDQHKLRNLVFEKTGVRIDVDDPVFALVALNEAVLAEAVDRHVDRIEAASVELAERARAAGGLPRAHAAVSEFEPAPAVPAHAAQPATAAATALPFERRPLVLAAGAAVLGAVLVLAGQALFFRAPPPAPVTVPAPLTTAQIEALATAEKFNRALPKLDARTRTAVLNAMQQP